MSDEDAPLTKMSSERTQRANRKKLNDIKLIRLVRAQRALYEPDDTDYHNQLKRELIWEEIAKQMGRKMDDCRRRWFNIRDCYRKGLMKRQSKDDRELSKPLRFEKEMAFMIPHLRSKRRRRYSSQEDNSRTPEVPEIPEISENIEEHQYDDPLNSVSRDASYTEVEHESNELSPEEVTMHTLSPVKEDLVQDTLPDDDVEVATEIHDILQELVSWRREEKRIKKDQIGTFFRSIEETVRTLPWALQIEAKKKISSVVFDLELRAPQEAQGHSSYDVTGGSNH